MLDDRATPQRSTRNLLLLIAIGSLGWASVVACSSTNAGLAPAADAGSGDGSSAKADSGTTTSDAGNGTALDAASSSDGAASADAAGSFVLTSPAFAEGAPIPSENTCAGIDTSPELDWSAGPAATLSYAIVVTDLDTGGVTNDAGVVSTPNIHWVIWDLPSSVRSLPAVLPSTPTLTSPVSANQVDLRTVAADAGPSMNGYFGPCPNGNLHRYQFALHAMDVAMLPGVTTSTTSTDVKAVVLQHSLAEADLTGTSNAVRAVADAAADQ